MFSLVKTLFLKDLRLDLRQKFGLGSIFLYVFSAVFIIYLAFGEVDGRTWVTLFWIIVLFASVNAVLKSFVQEDASRRLYYYTLSGPYSVVIAKLLYNCVVVLIIIILSLALFSLTTRYPILSSGYFVLALLLGVLGIAANFTFVSSIASHTRQANTMMMVLSLPVIIPLLLPLIRLSIKSLGPLTWAMVKSDLTMLVAVDLLIIGLLLLLYPFLWRS
ncbi:MAG: ABC transporter permease [Saprospiraceae bacterium]|nr:ABC transporter permease [Saprospiraceae bacterium]